MPQYLYPGQKYPWEEWFNESIFEVRSPDDFGCSPKIMRRMLRRKAQQFGRRIRVDSFKDDYGSILYVQQVDEKGRAIKEVPQLPIPEPRPLPPPRPVGQRGAPEKYPWEKWLDGREHKLARYVDFETPAVSFCILAQSKAYTVRFPFPIRVSRSYDIVTIQAERPIDTGTT